MGGDSAVGKFFGAVPKAFSPSDTAEAIGGGPAGLVSETLDGIDKIAKKSDPFADPPSENDPAVDQAASQQRVARGRAATILNGGAGLSSVYKGARRVLLGN